MDDCKYKYIRRHHYESTKAGLIHCNSSYELRAAILLDEQDVLTYRSQVCFLTPSGRKRYADFVVEYQDGRTSVIEVKPASRLARCQEQIDDNRAYATSNSYDFQVWTEQELGFSSPYEAKKWADKFLSEWYGIDFVAATKQMNLKKAKKHYDKAIATDKVEVYCGYCQAIHNPLRLTYEKNIAANGVYICERYGGHLAGKKPKKKKDNPYVSEGKKQCTMCEMVLSFESFSPDNSRRDGYCSRCKDCRAANAKQRYHDNKSLQ